MIATDVRTIAREDLEKVFDATNGSFTELLPHLKKTGFPDPLPGTEDVWDAGQLIEWVIAQQERNIAFVRHLESWLEPVRH